MNLDDEQRRQHADAWYEVRRETWRGKAVIALLSLMLGGAVVTLALHWRGIW